MAGATMLGYELGEIKGKLEECWDLFLDLPERSSISTSSFRLSIRNCITVLRLVAMEGFDKEVEARLSDPDDPAGTNSTQKLIDDLIASCGAKA